jgi:hypothetical protein
MSQDGIAGTKDRIARIEQRRSGPWSTVSSDFLFLASKLYKLSEQEARLSPGGNSSQMVFAGIPLLVSSIYALIIECESIGVLGPPAIEPMEAIPNVLHAKYSVEGEQLTDVRCLCEVRNELVHPVPLPTGTFDNWPDYLRRIKDKRLLVGNSDPTIHHLFFGQMASHELFTWAVFVTYGVYQAVIKSVPDRGMMLPFFLTAFGNFVR